jgi:hypothetical protein
LGFIKINSLVLLTMNEAINRLRIFFRVSNAAIESVMNISAAFGNKPILTPMYQMHKLALHEIEKENPDLVIIDKYLLIMEGLAKECTQYVAKPLPEFPAGRVESGSHG